jgi:hypothetical protein
MLKILHRARSRLARRRYDQRTRRWRIGPSRGPAPTEPAPEVQAPSFRKPTPTDQMSLFAVDFTIPEDGKLTRKQRLQLQWAAQLPSKRKLSPLERKKLEAEARAKRRRKKRVKKVKKALQYRIYLEQRDRKIGFKPRSRAEVGGNDITFAWSEADWRRLHVAVFLEAIKTLKEHLSIGSHRAGDVVAWISRVGDDEPFNYETCARIASECLADPSFRPFAEDFEVDVDFAGLDPDAFRDLVLQWVKRSPHYRIDYATLLKCALLDADAGDQGALAWITSESQARGSFIQACESLGFEPTAVRKQPGLESPDGAAADSFDADGIETAPVTSSIGTPADISAGNCNQALVA